MSSTKPFSQLRTLKGANTHGADQEWVHLLGKVTKLHSVEPVELGDSADQSCKVRNEIAWRCDATIEVLQTIVPCKSGVVLIDLESHARRFCVCEDFDLLKSSNFVEVQGRSTLVTVITLVNMRDATEPASGTLDLSKTNRHLCD